jgi:hypothetical protein
MAIQLYKRANGKGPEKDTKDPSKQKWNAQSIFVEVEGEMIPFSELEKVARKNAFVPIEKAENEVEIDGVNHDVNELINMYKASKKNMTDKEDPALQAGIKGMKKFAKKNMDDKDDEKENTVAGAVEDNEDENSKAAAAKKNEDAGKEDLEKGEGKDEGSSKVVTQKGKNKKMKDNDSDEGFVKDTTKEGKKNEDDVEDKEEEMKENEDDEDEDVKESIKKQSKSNDNGKSKDVRHFIRLNSARENGDASGGILTLDTMYNRIDRGKSRYGTN